MTVIQGVVAVIGLFLFLAWPLKWTVSRILRPIDQAAKERNLPFRFSISDFLCLFWMVQLPLAFVFQIDGDETEQFYWTLTVVVWAVAPLVWITCARALSKAGVSGGKHRIIFLAVVVPTVYYGLFPFIGLSIGIVLGLAAGEPGFLWQYRSWLLLWVVLGLSLVASGFYSPWLVRQVQLNVDDDEVPLEPIEH